MNTWSNAVITTKGVALLAKLIAGNTLTITKAQSGSGSVAVSQLVSQTAVTSPQQTLTFRTVSYPETGKAALPVYLTNENLATGYTATQIGIFAQDPDDGEILFFIAQAASGSGTNIPSSSEMTAFTAEWTFYFQYGDADSVTVTVDPANSVSQTEATAMISTAVNQAKAELQSNIDDITATALGALPTSGGNMTGNIGYASGTRTGDMIRFISGDANGSGVAIGDGGSVVIGGGESAQKYEPAAGGGATEQMIIANDTTIQFYTNVQSGVNNAKSITFNTDGSITASGGFNGTQKKITSGTAAPSGGSNGDIYIQYQ